jgi:hypothetical protein
MVKKLADLNEELAVRDSTVSDLESHIHRVTSESERLQNLMEQSLLMTETLQQVEESGDIKSIEREMWALERECRRISSSSRPSSSSDSTELSLPPSPLNLKAEFRTTKEEIADLKRAIQQITQSPLDSPTFSTHSRQSTTEHHHHHHYYYPVNEISSPPPPQQTPMHTKFFTELPTPPATASSISSLSMKRLSTLSAWPQNDYFDPETPCLPRDLSQSSILTTSSNPSFLSVVTTPTLKRSTSHESIFDSTPSRKAPASHPLSPGRSPLASSSATSSPTFLSASAYLRQNRTSSVLLLSSTRGKQSRGLSSRKSFWNLWETRSPRSGGSGRKLSSLWNGGEGEMGRPVVVCTEVDIGMLRDALDG